MVDRKDIGSWLEGPGSRAPESAEYPGERLGLAREGAGSIGRVGRRVLGVLIDWTLCTLIAFGVFDVPLPPPTRSIISQLFAHIVLVGIPIALAAARMTRRPAIA